MTETTTEAVESAWDEYEASALLAGQLQSRARLPEETLT
jgi:hypothetical protein